MLRRCCLIFALAVSSACGDAQTAVGPEGVGPAAVGDLDQARGNVPLSSRFSVLNNDACADCAISYERVTANGGTVVMTTAGADAGRFTYEPPLGFWGSGEAADSFHYTLTNSGGSSTATVHLEVEFPLWFVNADAASDGDGRLTHPFKYLQSLAAVNDGVGHHPGANGTIFLRGSATSYSGDLTLLPGQSLLGQGALALSYPEFEDIPDPFRAELAQGNGSASRMTGRLTLGGWSRWTSLAGLTLGPVVGTDFGTVRFHDVAIDAGAAIGLDLARGEVVGSIRRVSSSGGAHGIRLLEVRSAVAVTVTGDGSPGFQGGNGSGGTLSNHTGADVSVSRSSLSLVHMRMGNARFEFRDGYGWPSSLTLDASSMGGLTVTGGESATLSVTRSAIEGLLDVQGPGTVSVVDSPIDGGVLFQGPGAMSVDGGTISGERGLRVTAGSGATAFNLTRSLVEGEGWLALEIQQDLAESQLRATISGNTFRQDIAIRATSTAGLSRYLIQDNVASIIEIALDGPDQSVVVTGNNLVHGLSGDGLIVSGRNLCTAAAANMFSGSVRLLNIGGSSEGPPPQFEGGVAGAPVSGAYIAALQASVPDLQIDPRMVFKGAPCPRP